MFISLKPLMLRGEGDEMHCDGVRRHLTADAVCVGRQSTSSQSVFPWRIEDRLASLRAL